MNIYSPYLDFAEKFKFNFRDSSGFDRINDDELMMIDVSNYFNCFTNGKAFAKISFDRFKNNIKSYSDRTIHKIKLFDRTLSWFFKRSKPGGGRGL